MENKKYTCLVTIVQPGLPDSVIRVSPADHKEEKVWLDTRPGMERWMAIQALMQRFCPRGKYVPSPAFYHPATGKQEDLQTLLIHGPDDIPLVELDGATLSAPPAKEHAVRPDKTELQSAKDQVVTLTETVNKLTVAVANIVEAMAVKKAPGRPRKEDAI